MAPDAARARRDETGAAYERLVTIQKGDLHLLPQWAKSFGLHGMSGDEALYVLGGKTSKHAVQWDDASTSAHCGGYATAHRAEASAACRSDGL